MPHRKRPEDTSADTNMIAPDNSIFPPNTEMQIAFLQEAKRFDRFGKYHQVAEQYLELARDTEIDAKQAARLLQEVLDDVELSTMALSTEELIRVARPAIQRALSMIKHKMNRDSEGRPVYNEQALATAKLSSVTIHSELNRALRSFPPRISAPDEQMMRLSEPTGRQKRIAAHSKHPERMKDGAVPELSDEIKRNLKIFAAGNAAMTLHDIDALMVTLKDKRHFFASELEACKEISDIIEEMREQNLSEDKIRQTLKENGIENRVRTFQEMVLELEVALRIASARMKFANQPDNKLLAREITSDQIKRLLTEGVIDVRLIQGNRAGIVGALKRILPKRKTEHSGETELTLRKALARRHAK